MKSFRQRLMSKVSINPTLGCWDWIGARGRDGYGILRVQKNKTQRAHRISFEVHIGPIPDGMCICHKCDNPLCINPEHLFLGTNAENTHDRTAKGRSARQYGASNGSVKIADDAVAAIRAAEKRWGVNTRLAAQYGVSKTLVSLIRAGKRRSPVRVTIESIFASKGAAA